MKNLKNQIEDNGTLILKVGCDVGNSFTKTAGGNNYFDCIDSCVVENAEGEHEEGVSTLDYNGKNFTVGQGYLITESVGRRSLEKYEVLTIFSICKYIRTENINTLEREVIVHLGIGLPTGDYNKYRETYSAIFRDKVVECIYEGAQIKFKIEEVRTVPQGTVVAYLNENIFKDTSLGFLIDWGSYTVDVQAVRNGELIKTEKNSYEVGIIRMLSDIGNVMKNLGGAFTNYKDIERALIDGSFVTEEGEISIEHEDIQKVIRREVKHIVETIKLEFGGLRNSKKTYIIGGGAIVFEQILRESFVNCCIAPDSEKLNAEAFYEFVGGR